MKTLFSIGLSLTGFSATQLLSFVAIAYPQARWGAALLLLLLAIAIAVSGLINWIGVQTKNIGMGRNNFLIGFAPTIAIGAVFLIAIACGIYIALG